MKLRTYMQQIHTNKQHNDNASVLGYGMDNVLLMENASNSLAYFLQKLAKRNRTSNIIFLCGGGNNGADGLATARILKTLMPHLSLQVILLQMPKTPLCKKHFSILSKFATANYNPQYPHLQSITPIDHNNEPIDIITYFHFLIPFMHDKPSVSAKEFLERLQTFLELLPSQDIQHVHQDIIYRTMPLTQQCHSSKPTLMQDKDALAQDSLFYAISNKISTHFPHLDNAKIFWQTFLYYEAFLHNIALESLCYRYISTTLQSLSPDDIIIDCLFGSGFDNTKRTLSMFTTYQWLQSDFKLSKAIKVACDTPSGVPNILGHTNDLCDILGKFDYTFSMGAISLCLLDSRIKDSIGKIKLGGLGIPKRLYDKSPYLFGDKPLESTTKSSLQTAFLLEKTDLKLPQRNMQNTHKGSYGTTYIIAGEMQGATLLAAKAAQSFGSGKTCIYEAIIQSFHNKDCEIIYTKNLPSINTDSTLHNNNAFGIGMGLGYSQKQYNMLFDNIATLCGWQDFTSLTQHITQLHDCSTSPTPLLRDEKKPYNPLYNQAQKEYCSIPFVFDADILYRQELSILLSYLSNAVLTPHPKEFLALLRNLGIVAKDYSLDTLLRNIPSLALQFSQKLPNVVCLIKGANTTIIYQHTLYIHILGKSNLAKGGSGDVLSGMIASLLAQGYNNIDACIQASLAHALASKKAMKKWGSYALTPLKLIESIEKYSTK